MLSCAGKRRIFARETLIAGFWNKKKINPDANLEKNPLTRGITKIHVLMALDTEKSIVGKTRLSICLFVCGSTLLPTAFKIDHRFFQNRYSLIACWLTSRLLEFYILILWVLSLSDIFQNFKQGLQVF